MVDLTQVFSKELCEHGLAVTNKKELLEHCAQAAHDHPCMGKATAKDALKGLLSREGDGSTGFGNGIAIPHARVAGMKGFIFFIVTLKEPIDFDAVDKKPVNIAFVVLGPAKDVQDHLRILAFISRCIAHTDLCTDLLAAKGVGGVVDAFLQHSGTHAGRGKEGAGADSHSVMLFITVYREEHLQEILEVLLENDIAGSTIIETTGMGHYLSQTPLFGNFIGFMQENKYHSHTIMAVAPRKKVEPLVSEIEQIAGDFKKTQNVSIITLGIDRQYGSMDAV